MHRREGTRKPGMRLAVRIVRPPHLTSQLEPTIRTDSAVPWLSYGLERPRYWRTIVWPVPYRCMTSGG